MKYNKPVISVLMPVLRWQKSLLLLVLITSCSAQHVCYVTPTPDTPCPGEPCHTLSEYVANQYFNNLPVNTTIKFLSGSHSLQYTVSVTNLIWLTINGDSSSLPEITSRIVCTWPAEFVFTDITQLHISSLALISCGHNDSASMNIISVQQSNISNCSFYCPGYGPRYDCNHNGGALYIKDSNVIVTGNIFQNNSGVRGGYGGGALYVLDSNLTVTDNTFQNNSATGNGGVLFGVESTLTVRNNAFHNNSATVLSVLDSNLTTTDKTFERKSAGEGGVLYVKYCTLTITNNTFQNNSAIDTGGVLSVTKSTLTVTGNIFQSNSAGHAGVLYAFDCNSTITDNTFQHNSAGYAGVLYVFGDTPLNVKDNTFLNNSATDHGGVLFLADSIFTITNNTFQNNSARYGGVLSIFIANILTITNNIFLNNYAEYGGVLEVADSNLTVTDNAFQNNSATGNGGVLFVVESTLTVRNNAFHNNSATVLSVLDSNLTTTDKTFERKSSGKGGVLYVKYCTLTITNNTFQNNSAIDTGGVLSVIKSTLTVTGNIFQSNSAGQAGVLYAFDCNSTITDNTFQHNSAGFAGVLFVFGDTPLNVNDNTFLNNSANDYGGVLFLADSIFTITNNTFQKNSARYGGVLSILIANILTVTNNIFLNNYAEYGGVLDVADSDLTITNNTFQSNSATLFGVLWLFDSTLTITDNTFKNNSANGGGVLCIKCSNVNLIGNIFQKNIGTTIGGALYVNGYFCHQKIVVSMSGNNTIENNRAEYGGGIAVLGKDGHLELKGNTTVKNCTARYGGGLYVHNTEIAGYVTLFNNSAIEGGGGMYVSSSTLNFTGNSTIMNNLVIGGGLLLSGQSEFYLQPNVHVNFISNSAKNTGGAIKVEERNPLTYCIHSAPSRFSLTNGNSDCFFQMPLLKKYPHSYSPSKIIDDLKLGLHFDNNSAEAGADIYGGSVDACILSNVDTISLPCTWCTSGAVLDDMIISENTSDISSDPLYICTCMDNQRDCTGSYHPEPVYPGGTLEVPVIAHGQRNGTTAAVIHTITTLNSNITVGDQKENIQKANTICTNLKYTIQSFEENTIQSMTLYAQGPCPPTISNTLTILIKVLPCPPGFQLSDTQPICICTKRLQQFTNSCLVDNRTIHRTQRSQFWVGYDNKSKDIILHPHCPFDYCTSEEMHFAVDDSEKQCNYNRSGLLCGRCSDNLSLAFGTFHCLQCSNSYLSLLVAFAFSGIVLVVFLLVLRLTVVAGTINALIFYANIVTANSAVFFQSQVSNALTIFVAWLNLDLGIETCFYNGMDAYVKTWLQFVFPIYVWALVGMIIIGSYYSGRVARIFGSNPVAVLATLFLLSYAKLLRTCIAVLSYTFLEYPNNSQIAVWLHDGNIGYLSGKHIPLFIFATVCLVFLFFPYMMLLIFSQWLQAKSKFKIISWINSPKLKPFLDAYHAPYTDKHRYWTGLLLLLRLVLFLIPAVNALGDPSVNLLAIASTTAAILTLPTILSSRIYKTWTLVLLETSFLLNLTILAVATLYIQLRGGNQNAAIFTSVSIAFATFIGIVIYHAIQQIKATRLWRRVYLKHDYTLTDVASGRVDPPDSVFVSGSAPTQTVIEICYHELREPCMATD